MCLALPGLLPLHGVECDLTEEQATSLTASPLFQKRTQLLLGECNVQYGNGRTCIQHIAGYSSTGHLVAIRVNGDGQLYFYANFAREYSDFCRTVVEALAEVGITTVKLRLPAPDAEPVLARLGHTGRLGDVPVEKLLRILREPRDKRAGRPVTVSP